MLRIAIPSTCPSEAVKWSAYMNHTITAPTNAPKNSAIAIGMNCSAGSTPKTTLASAIAGLILTPPKMNKVTVIPNAHVVMANK